MVYVDIVSIAYHIVYHFDACMLVYIIMRLKRFLLFYTAYCISQSLRYRHYLSRTALPSRYNTAWYNLLQCNDDRAWITLLSIDSRTFTSLYTVFINHYAPSPQSSMRSVDVLGLCLLYVTSKCERNKLQCIFSITLASYSRHLSNGLKALELTVSEHPDCYIRWPRGNAFSRFSTYITAWESQLNDYNVWGFVDGVFFQIQNPRDEATQNAYYNSWRAYCSVTNVIVFTPDGCICWVSYNNPGSWHDSMVASRLYETLNDHTPNGYHIVGDSAFNQSSRILTPRKENQHYSDDPTAKAAQYCNHTCETSSRVGKWKYSIYI